MPRMDRQGKAIGESDRARKAGAICIFRPADIAREFFNRWETTALCGWEGRANYFTVVIDGVENRRAAWYDAAPEPAASLRARRHSAYAGQRRERNDRRSQDTSRR
jgi:uncharacterized protein (DUF427 family)